ncbi:MAG: FAD-dependent oxidoreductase [Chloroflexota bacterium]
MEVKLGVPTKWDKEADVVVVGYGAAGVATAITAQEAGAKVLILEKAPRGEEGGNSRVAAQAWFSPTPVDRAIIYLKALCGPYPIPDDVVRAWAEAMAKNTEWVESLGGKPIGGLSGVQRAEFPELPGADCVHGYRLHEEMGYERFWNLLKAATEKKGIEILYATPGKELIQNPNTKEIIGIKAERQERPFNIKANKAVVLTCGGFEANQEMVRNYLRMPYCYPLGTPYNTGDGIKMAMTVGADLWHMTNAAGPFYHLKVPEFPAVMEIIPLHYAREFPGGMILVGANGRRFVNEKQRNTHGKVIMNGQWVQSPSPCPLFMIFDHALFSLGPLYDNNFYHGWNQILKLYQWSKDNSAELAKGWIKKADTLAELAKLVKLDPAALEDTVKRWNSDCAAGKDSEFGRARMLVPIKDAPFYAIEISPTFLNTQGGPRRNARGQIVRPDGSPIPRLYSAGELGSIYSYLYQGGGNLGECIAFGRISGRNAAAEKSWE